MELSEQTLNILSNFKNIQANMVFRPGNEIKTMADAKNIMAKATLDSTIDSEFGIYDLNEFLATLNLVDSPKLDLKKDHCVISSTSGRSRIKYFFSDPDMLTSPVKDVAMPESMVSFILDENTLLKIKKAAATLGHDMLLIKPASGALELSVVDPESSTSNAFSIDIAGSYKQDGFQLVMNINNLKVIPTSYEVNIPNRPISHFKSQDKNIPVEYWIALEKSSEY